MNNHDNSTKDDRSHSNTVWLIAGGVVVAFSVSTQIYHYDVRVVRLELGGAEVEEIAGGNEEEEVKISISYRVIYFTAKFNNIPSFSLSTRREYKPVIHVNPGQSFVEYIDDIDNPSQS